MPFFSGRICVLPFSRRPSGLMYASVALLAEGVDRNFNGLLSEKLVLTHTRRGDRWAWEKLPGHNRNEALDCRDYANAGLKIINPDMDAIERRLQGLEEKPKAPQQRRQRQRHNRADAFDDW